MAHVTSRVELVDYCYRHLGAPLVEINMTEEQADDLVDEAIGFFRDYYFDGIEKAYVKHQIVETDMTNGYIILPDLVFGVNRVFPTAGTTSSQTNIFDLQYQLRMNDLRDLTSTSMIYYTQVMQHISLIDNLLNTQKQFRWNKLTNKLYIDQNWSKKVAVGEWILIDCYMALDPQEAPKFWDDRYFKKYCSALFKRQWGQNISKFGGITLPGGVTIDGDKIYEQGKQEADDIEADIMTKLAPLEWVLG